MSWCTEGNSPRDIKIGEIHIAQKHIDPAQVVYREVNFMTVKLSNIFDTNNLRKFKEQRTRSRTRSCDHSDFDTKGSSLSDAKNH